jgi:arylsulfatase A-like enzyme
MNSKEIGNRIGIHPQRLVLLLVGFLSVWIWLRQLTPCDFGERVRCWLSSFLAAFNFYAPHYPAEHPASLDDLYRWAGLPPDPSFSEADVSDKPLWVRRLDRVDREERQVLTEFHRDRLRSVEYVDQAVSRIVNAMSRAGELDNTYIVFWGDNGYHLGQHRLQQHTTGGKLSPYTHDVKLPMYVRGPGIPAGSVSEKMVSNVDAAPTFADMGGASVPTFVDGRSLVPLAKGEPVGWRKFAYSAAWPKSEGVGASYMEDWRQIRTAEAAYHYYPRGRARRSCTTSQPTPTSSRTSSTGASPARTKPYA